MLHFTKMQRLAAQKLAEMPEENLLEMISEKGTIKLIAVPSLK